MNTMTTKHSTCARCGAHIKYEYEYNGKIYGSTCIFRELGIKFSDEELYDIRINHGGSINSYFEKREQAEQKAQFEKKRCIEKNTEKIAGVIQDLNLDVDLSEIDVTEDFRMSAFEMVNNKKVKASVKCTLLEKDLRHGTYSDYYYMKFTCKDYEISLQTSAKKVVELKVGDSCSLSFVVEHLYADEKHVWGKRPKIIS